MASFILAMITTAGWCEFFHVLALQAPAGNPNGGFSAGEAAEYWGSDLNPSNQVSECVANAIYSFADAEGYRSLADYGAGLGGFALYFKEKGIPEVYCYDADPVVEKSSKGLCKNVDLGKFQPALPKVDLAMTLEVGEHIPKKFEQHFLDNVASAGTKAVVVSWAHPWQGGTRHVNERPQWYIADQLRQRGYGLDRSRTSLIRTSAHDCKDYFFWQNTMAFKRRSVSEDWYDSWSDFFWLKAQELNPSFWWRWGNLQAMFR